MFFVAKSNMGEIKSLNLKDRNAAHTTFSKMMTQYFDDQGFFNSQIRMKDVDIERYILWSIYEFVSYLSTKKEGAEPLSEEGLSAIEEELKQWIKSRVEWIYDKKPIDIYVNNTKATLKDRIDFFCKFIFFFVNKLTNKVVEIADSLYEGRKKGLHYFLLPSDYHPFDDGICI
jgi:hypothetical protein